MTSPADIVVVSTSTTTTTVTATSTETAVSTASSATNSTAASGFPNVSAAFQAAANQFTIQSLAIIRILDQRVIQIALALSIFLLVLGITLWSSRIERRLGKGLTLGGIALIVAAEWIFPWLTGLPAAIGLP